MGEYISMTGNFVGCRMPYKKFFSLVKAPIELISLVKMTGNVLSCTWLAIMASSWFFILSAYWHFQHMTSILELVAQIMSPVC